MSDNNMKMADVFELPVYIDEDGDIVLRRGEYIFPSSEIFNPEIVASVPYAINNHDRLTAENEVLLAEVKLLREHNDELQQHNVGLAESELKLQQERDQLKALLNEHFIEWEKDSGDWDEFEWHDRVSVALFGKEQVKEVQS